MGIGSFYLKCKRVWRALKKPGKQEYWMVTKVSAIGILLLGVLGFLISGIMKLFIR